MRVRATPCLSLELRLLGNESRHREHEIEWAAAGTRRWARGMMIGLNLCNTAGIDDMRVVPVAQDNR
jgi:hypothetical protein